MKRRSHTPEYKAKIVLEMLFGEKTASEIASREQIATKQLYNWRHEFTENASRAFSTTKDEREAREQAKAASEREYELMKKIGQLTIENDWLKKKSEDELGSGYKKKPNKY